MRGAKPTAALRPTRRHLLGRAAGLPLVMLSPGGAWADSGAELKQALAAVGKGRKPLSGRLKLDAPEIAENGSLVPIEVSFDSPMTEQDRVTAIHVFADGNPRPQVAVFRFGRLSGQARVAIRVRLQQTQELIALAETGEGNLYETRALVKVTIGGCGG
ncbi:MAG: thiosulfate oxidation carrier protein SoxY [Alphaproteobacteria bacterium]|nr:thiosulfate oxidation carrier protein SoxY [Alphaproteobacteria bacterium]